MFEEVIGVLVRADDDDLSKGAATHCPGRARATVLVEGRDQACSRCWVLAQTLLCPFVFTRGRLEVALGGRVDDSVGGVNDSVGGVRGSFMEGVFMGVVSDSINGNVCVGVVCDSAVTGTLWGEGLETVGFHFLRSTLLREGKGENEVIRYRMCGSSLLTATYLVSWSWSLATHSWSTLQGGRQRRWNG